MNQAKEPTISHWPITFLNGISAIIGLLLPLLMSRILPAEEIGKYKIIFLYITMVPALSLTGGIENGIYYWAVLAENAKERIRSAWSVASTQALGFFIILLLANVWIRHSFGWSTQLFIAFAFASLTVVVNTFYESLLIATHRIWQGAIFSAAFNLANNLIILAAVIVFKSAVTAVWAYTFVGFCKVLLTVYLGSRQNWIPLRPDFSRIKEVLQYHIPVSMAGIFDFLMGNSDRILLSALISPAQFAIYTFGCLSIPPLQILETSVNRVMIPKLAAAIESKDVLKAAQIYRAGLEQIMFLFIPAVIGLLVFADPIIRLLFTEKYIQASNLLRIYSLWYLLSGIPYDVAARASGNGKWILKNTIRMGIFSLGVCSLLSYLFGSYGAISAMILSLSVQKLFGINLMIKKYHWPFFEMIPWRSLGLFSLLATLLGAASWLSAGRFSKPLHWFLVDGAIFGVVYLGSLYLLRPDLFKRAKG